MLSEALIRAEPLWQPNIIGFLRELLGEQMSIDLSRLAEVANRLKANLEEGVALARSVEAASETAALRMPLRSGWSREVDQVPMPHRPNPCGFSCFSLRPLGMVVWW